VIDRYPQTVARSRVKGREPVRALSGQGSPGPVRGRQPVSSVRGDEP
jgi:hypothetical protein